MLARLLRSLLRRLAIEWWDEAEAVVSAQWLRSHRYEKEGDSWP